MNDMSSAIVPKSDQQNADDYISGPRTIKITKVTIAPGEQPVSIFFEGDEGKPYKPCKSMSRVLVAAWGPDAKAYIGRSATLYRDPAVKWGGMEVGGIRVSHLSNIDTAMTMALTATKGSRKPFTVKPLVEAPASSAAAQMLVEIAACANQPTLRRWWEKNGQDIPDQDYDRVLGAFNDRIAAIKSTSRPAAGDPAPAVDEPLPNAGDAAAPAEGRGDEDMGEGHNGTEDTPDPPSLDAALAEIAGIELVHDLNARVRELSPLFAGEELDALTSAAMDRVAELKGEG